MEQTVSDVEIARLPTPGQAAEVEKLADQIFSTFLGMPIDAAANHISTTLDWADGARVIANQPDVPRNITATLTDADNSVTGLLTILGKDCKGRVVQETMQPLGDGNGKTLVGTKIFAEVTSAIISGTAGAAGGDALVIGVGDLIGVPWDLNTTNAVLFAWLGGTKLTPDAIATGVSTSGVDVNSGTMDGAKWLQVLIQPGRLV